MARKRMIDPSIWADESFGQLSYEAMSLFIGIISNADDEGRLPGNALFLASTIFPYKGITQKQATTMRDEVLTKMLSVKLYIIAEKEYIQLTKWSSYQSINKPSRSKYPPLPENYGSTTVGLPPNRIEKNRIEEKRREDTLPLKNSLKYLENVPLEDMDTFIKKYEITKEQIQSKANSLAEYCRMHGKVYKDYQAFLRNSIDKDFKKRPERGYSGVPLSKIV